MELTEIVDRSLTGEDRSSARRKVSTGFAVCRENHFSGSLRGHGTSVNVLASPPLSLCVYESTGYFRSALSSAGATQQLV